MPHPFRKTALLLPLFAAPVVAQNLVALTTDNRILPVRTGSPLQFGPAVPITGLQAGESVLGIDFRPATGQLYGLGSSSRLYVIDPANGAATAVGAGFAPPLAGSEFGFDFNPTVDRIRVVGDSGQNLRLHPDTGAVAATDGSLQFAPGDANVGATALVAASAYTNSFAGATNTILYGIDAGLDVLVTQIPPNSGTLNTVGSLGRDVTSVAGFDITPNGAAWAVLNTAGAANGNSQLFAIDLATGATTFAGAIPNANPGTRIRGLAAAPQRPDVEIVALAADGRIARFDATTPWAAPAIASITGLAAGESILGIDFRPATGQLYGLGSTSRLYTIDTTSGVASPVGTIAFTPALAGTRFGFDFNPTVDRIRIVSDAAQNLRAHPDTGAIVAIDGTLAYAAGDPGFGTSPGVTAAAYTNSLPGATSTTLWVLDTDRDVLATQIPPNNGTLNTIAPLPFDVADAAGFDFGTDGTAFAALQAAGGSTRLYRVDVGTGALTPLADLGLALGTGVRGLAVRPAAGVSAFGAATPGCNGPTLLGAAGTPFAGSSLFSVTTSRGPANAPGFFVLAVNRLASPIDVSGIAVWLDVSTVVVAAPRMTDAAGAAAVTMPLQGAWFGLDLFLQWVAADACGPIGLSTSAGLRVTVQ